MDDEIPGWIFAILLILWYGPIIACWFAFGLFIGHYYWIH